MRERLAGTGVRLSFTQILAIGHQIAGDADSPITSGTLVVGTPYYMSPEQARGATREAILARQAIDPVPPVTTVRPEVGPATDAVLRTALAKSPARRYATAGETVTALERALARRGGGPAPG